MFLSSDHPVLTAPPLLPLITAITAASVPPSALSPPHHSSVSSPITPSLFSTSPRTFRSSGATTNHQPAEDTAVTTFVVRFLSFSVSRGICHIFHLEIPATPTPPPLPGCVFRSLPLPLGPPPQRCTRDESTSPSNSGRVTVWCELSSLQPASITFTCDHAAGCHLCQS